jgi:hypothetical protein
MERGLGKVKRSGRDEPMYVVIHKCMEAMLGISLYAHISPKLANILCLSYYLLRFSLQQNWRRGQNKFCLEVRGREEEGSGVQGGEMAQTMCAHVNTCISN